MNEIIPNLWLGDLIDAMNGDDKVRIDVRWPSELVLQPYLAPKRLTITTTCIAPDENIISDPAAMNLVADLINLLRPDHKILVHCVLGMDRSPLTVVWYLMAYEALTLDQAYKLVCEKHPDTRLHKDWTVSYV